MPLMPGEVVEGPWSPEGEAMTQRITAREPAPYRPQPKPAAIDPKNPYSSLIDQAPSSGQVTAAKPGWKERYIANFRAAQRYGTAGIYELGDIRDAATYRDLLPGLGGTAYQQTDADMAADAAYLGYSRQEDVNKYNRMPGSESLLDWTAAIGGQLAGSLADPLNLINPEIRVGTVGWRSAHPVLGRVLETGVSNAAMNAGVNATIQAEEGLANIRDEFDWRSFLTDLGVGAVFGGAMGLPGGLADARAADFYQSHASPEAPEAPRAAPEPKAPEIAPEPKIEPATPQALSGRYSSADLDRAQEALFGEVVGTRNLNPDQLDQIDTYLAGGRAGEIPQAPTETAGGLKNERTAQPNGEAVPPMRDVAPPAEKPLPPVRESGQPQGGAAPGTVKISTVERQFHPSELKVDAKRFQFKEGGNEAGVTDRLKGVKKWDPLKSGVTLVWEDVKGDFYIADGHQRHALAVKLAAEGQDTPIRAVVLREADGIDSNTARALAAAKNIAEGTGNAVDAAKILRSRPEIGVDLPPTSALVRDAQGLTNLSDDAFGMVINKKVPAGYAAIVGRLADDKATHADLLGMLAREDPASAIEAESMVRDALEAPAVQATMEDMFGTSQTTQILYKERAQVLSGAATALRKDRAAFNVLVKEEARLTGAGNQLATQTNLERALQDAEILATLQATARRKGPVADALAAAAKSLHDGAPRQVAIADFLGSLRRAGAAMGEAGSVPGAPGRPEQIAASLGGYRSTTQPAFKKWFGDSKVVDANGEPLVVYHTTGADFEAFKTQPDDVGMHFGTKGQAADRFALKQERDPYRVELGRATPSTIPVYLAIKKPLRLPDLGAWNAENMAWKLTEIFGPEARKLKSTSQIRAFLVDRGYDGIVYKNTGETGGAEVLRQAMAEANRKLDEVFPGKNSFTVADQQHPAYIAYREAGNAYQAFRESHAEDSYIVFSPTQIKSIFNRGTWDATDPRIAYGFMRPNPQVRDTIAGQPVVFPDAEHLRLYKLGSDLLDGKPVDPAEPKAMLDTFKGYVTDETYDPFSTPDDAADMAMEYAGGLREEAAKGRPVVADDILANDEARVEWMQRTRPTGESLFPQEKGVEGKTQLVIPGAEKASNKRLAEMKARAPLKAGRPQKDMDFGLFGDSQNQLDLVDLARIPKMTRADADYIDFSPTASPRSNVIGETTINYAVREGEVEILSIKTPVASRRQGKAREALLAFLEKVDDENLKVRAYSTPLDNLTHREGVIRLYEAMGFTTTGRKINAAGDLEMLRSGPPPEVKELRNLVGSGRLIPLRDYVDPATAKKVNQTFINTQPDRVIDDLYEGGILQRRQDELASWAREIEQETGAKLGNPGVKDKAKAIEKIDRKGYKGTKQLTDLVRVGFEVKTPDQAQRIVHLLAQRFHVLDEGWTITPQYYFDRKVLVKFRDGTIGEVQIWEPSLIDAKMNRGGHDFYEAARVLPDGDPERLRLEQKMIELYRPLVEALDPAWSATVGRGGNWPNVSENSAFISSSPVRSAPESPTSIKSTGAQSSPGASTAQARPSSVMTAGRDSQSTNLNIESSISPKDMAFATRPQPGSNMPVNRSQAGVPAVQRQSAERLETIASDLASITGSPVRQGRLQRAPKGQRVAGQYDRGQGVIRLREMADIETQTHETAHSLETQFGRSLNTIKVQHRLELEPLAYAGADPKQRLSEGFAEWFRFYITSSAYARNQAPQFTAAFEQMIPPEMLAKLTDIKTRYLAWTTAPSGAVVAADVVSMKRGGTISEMVAQAKRNGVKAAIGDWMSQAYTATIDKLNPINRSVDQLLQAYEKRTGHALDLKSAQDPYRLARLLQDAYSAGHIDAVHGVVPYQGVASQGPGLSDAIEAALGRQLTGWDDELMADFAAYLISRRAVREYDRYIGGAIPNAPGKFTRGDYEITIREMEAAHPDWVNAAAMVHEWGRNMLRKKYEAGFITQELYDELVKRPDYVPFMRDLTDLDRDFFSPGGANTTLRNEIMKAFKGSKRSIINPLESMLQDAYHTNALIMRNEVFRTLDDLAQMAGPEGGKIVERIPSTALKGTTVDVNEVLRVAGKEAGINPSDLDQLTSTVDALMGDDAKATIFRAGKINEKGEPIVYVWRDGKQHALRLADGEFGRELYNSLTGMNKEARNLFVSVLALPTTVVRYGVTTAPHFIMANYIRDQLSAWVLAGDGFIPFVSGARGLWDEISQAESSRIYNTVGGLMGGANVASLNKGRMRRDISALQKKGYTVKRFATLRGFAEFTELSETGTRLGVFRNSFKRAKASGLTDYEAAIEAAFQARDYIDFGRHGSQTHTARRLVTFLNASVQGLDKAVRVLTGEGSIRKAITPYLLHRTGRPLSVRDRANLAKSAAAWAKVTAIGIFGLSLSAMYQDDPEYQEISEYLRATHWMVKKGPGEWYAIPKPFELGFVSNLFERSYESVYGRNPIAMQSFLSGLYEVTAPPSGIPIFETMYELKHNTDDMGRPIVNEEIAGFEPWRQYYAQTSEIAKQLGAAVNVSPALIDHAIQGFGSSWGRIITQASTDRAQELGAGEIIINSVSSRFVRDVTRGATSSRAFWDLVSQSNGSMAQAANTYKDLVENKGEIEAERMIETKDENTKAYAILEAYGEAKDKRLHPLNRARDAISAISKLRKELALNDVDMIESDKEEPEKIIVTADTRRGAQELLARLAMVEARNALITIKQPGWAQADYMDTATLYEDIRSLSPEIADELEARYKKKKVYDDMAVREAWPDVKERILMDRQDAEFTDIEAGM